MRSQLLLNCFYKLDSFELLQGERPIWNQLSNQPVFIICNNSLLLFVSVFLCAQEEKKTRNVPIWERTKYIDSPSSVRCMRDQIENINHWKNKHRTASGMVSESFIHSFTEKKHTNRKIEENPRQNAPNKAKEEKQEKHTDELKCSDGNSLLYLHEIHLFFHISIACFVSLVLSIFTMSFDCSLAVFFARVFVGLHRFIFVYYKFVWMYIVASTIAII